MQTLVNVALRDLFPQQCREWHSKKNDIRDDFSRERLSRKGNISQDVAKTEGSLRRALWEEVVGHVILSKKDKSAHGRLAVEVGRTLVTLTKK